MARSPVGSSRSWLRRWARTRPGWGGCARTRRRESNTSALVASSGPPLSVRAAGRWLPIEQTVEGPARADRPRLGGRGQSPAPSHPPGCQAGRLPYDCPTPVLRLNGRRRRRGAPGGRAVRRLSRVRGAGPKKGRGRRQRSAPGSRSIATCHAGRRVPSSWPSTRPCSCAWALGVSVLLGRRTGSDRTNSLIMTTPPRAISP